MFRMFVRITNTPRAYAWGSSTAIAELLGTEPTGEPEAELWLGAHPGSPSVIVDAGFPSDLAAWIADDPTSALGPLAASGRLPFLLKILAASSPLSLQAHPSPSQASVGFARENALGIPLDAPERNYRDAYPKPELIYALSPTFDALCGFRPLESARAIVNAFLDADAGQADPHPQPLEDLLQSLHSDDAPRTTFEWLLSNGAGVATLVALVTELAPSVSGFPLETSTVEELSVEYPGDPGIVISLLLNRVRLVQGEALYLPAGNIHAYLSGLGVELMTASDNVLRGGLTPKHVDVAELLSVLDFRTQPVPYLSPVVVSPSLELFRPDDAGVGFALARVTGDAVLDVEGPAIAICTGGSFSLAGSVSTHPLLHGESVYITPEEARLAITGDGTLFVAMTGR
jgi:mannose-6-phosphate isomerase